MGIKKLLIREGRDVIRNMDLAQRFVFREAYGDAGAYKPQCLACGKNIPSYKESGSHLCKGCRSRGL